MSRPTQLDKAIAQLEGELAVLHAALVRLQQEKARAAEKSRPEKEKEPRLGAVLHGALVRLQHDKALAVEKGPRTDD